MISDGLLFVLCLLLDWWWMINIASCICRRLFRYNRPSETHLSAFQTAFLRYNAVKLFLSNNKYVGYPINGSIENRNDRLFHQKNQPLLLLFWNKVKSKEHHIFYISSNEETPVLYSKKCWALFKALRKMDPPLFSRLDFSYFSAYPSYFSNGPLWIPLCQQARLVYLSRHLFRFSMDRKYSRSLCIIHHTIHEIVFSQNKKPCFFKNKSHCENFSDSWGIISWSPPSFYHIR